MVNTENKNWFEAAKSGNLSELKVMIKNGINPNSKDSEGMTALMHAASNGQIEVIKLLLGINNESVLDLVLEWKKSQKMREKMKEHSVRQWLTHWNAVDINARDHTGGTALLHAIRGGHYETVKLLIDLGADVNLLDNYDCSPLLIAVNKGYTDIVKWLINNGVDVNTMSKIEASYNFRYGGESALIYAIKNGRINIVRYLLKAGADVNIQNAEGKTPLMLAKELRYKNIEGMLIDAGADIKQK
eukprot:jgi/Orpsp1_1/1181772/evm.model.c7180000078530.1